MPTAVGRLTTGIVYIRSIGGTLTFSSGGVLSLADGTAAAPSLTFTNDAGTDTGMYLIGANNIGFSADGTLRFDYNTTRFLLSNLELSIADSGGTERIEFVATTDGGVVGIRDSAGTSTVTFDARTNFIGIGGNRATSGALRLENAQGIVWRNAANSANIAGPTLNSSNHIDISVAATTGFGYGTGAGGTVTQLTNKSTGVTLNNVTGIITMNNASLAADTTVSFTLTNSAIAATDAVIVLHESVGTLGAYSFASTAASGSVSIAVHNNTPGALAEAIVLRFVVIKSVNA